jgi:hypothetical protein
MSGKKQAAKPPKKVRFDVGAEVHIKSFGANGVVTHMDNAPSAIGEYWHVVKTEYGERREPGCNLELLPKPLK